MDRVKCLKCTALPQRHVFAVMGFLANVVAFSIRSCLSVAIIEMVVPINNTDIGTDSLVCPVDKPAVIHGDHARVDAPLTTSRFEWSQEQQGWVLSSYFIGYVVTQIPGGMIAEKYGGKWTLALGVLTMAVGSIAALPVVQYGGHFALIALRIVMGVASGAFIPSLNVLIAAWIPEKERGRLGSFIFSGSSIGMLLSLYVSGWMLSHWHWSVVFNFWGFLAIVWFFMFIILCSSDPASNRFITKEEMTYLKREMGQLQRNENLPSTPWKDILCSMPVLALIVAQIGHDWVIFVMASDLPKYMGEVLGFSFYDVGLYSSLPWMLQWVVSVLSGIVCDYLINGGYLTIVRARKIFTAVSGVLPAIFIVAASYAGCNKALVVVLITIGMGMTGPYLPGFGVNVLDLTPNYAGSLSALSNNLGSMAGVVTPVFIGMMAPNSAMEEWRFVFWITFGVVMVKTIIYSIWASAEVQPWNSSSDYEKSEDSKLTPATEMKLLQDNTV